PRGGIRCERDSIRRTSPYGHCGVSCPKPLWPEAHSLDRYHPLGLSLLLRELPHSLPLKTPLLNTASRVCSSRQGYLQSSGFRAGKAVIVSGPQALLAASRTRALSC